MVLSIMFVAAVGFAISVYAYFVEKKLLADESYKPACDINDRISCSKPLKSSYGKLFFVSNTIAGMIFYASIFALAAFDFMYLVFVGALAALVLTFYLAYLLYFKIKSYCIVCTSLYVVNILLFVLALRIIS